MDELQANLLIYKETEPLNTLNQKLQEKLNKLEDSIMATKKSKISTGSQ